MALTFARIWSCRGNDIVDEFFQRAEDAELHWHTEHNAAIKIQKVWRGYVVRKRIEKLHKAATVIQRYYRGYRGRDLLDRLLVERNKQRRMKYYYDMAARIQKTWRGYYSRKYKFDYYKRKAYIEGVKEKINLVRAQLAQHAMEQRRADSAYQASIQAQKLDRLAGSRHHLIGTKAIPGVYSTDKRSSTSDDDQPNSEASPSPTEKLIHEHLNSPLSPHKILPPIHIPPDRLRDNPTLKEWIKTHVGVRNYKGRPIRPPAESESESAEEREKKAQGPFLPRAKLTRILRKPLHPSLRVETGYYDTSEAEKEERRLRNRLRVAEKLFVIVPRVDHPHPDYFFAGDPFEGKKGRNKEGAENGTQKVFHNVVRPVPLFDELADWDY